MHDPISKIIASRRQIPHNGTAIKPECEGGCGVIGLACAEKIAGARLLPALCQMKNRGNSKGGGIAAAGLPADWFGVSQTILENDYLLAIALIDQTARSAIEKEYVYPLFEVDHIHEIPSVVQESPFVVLYFVRVKSSAVETFRNSHGLTAMPQNKIEDELVYQNTFALNYKFYGKESKRAFVLSHGKNLLVLKSVGFADDVIRHYKLETLSAHVWIGHHRYPTKGKVWHPGGAHPFIGLNEALVHNGDFANYSSLCEYLSQRHIYPQFSTDTEVAALLFDLLTRTYEYPLEYVMEAIAPTTEHDFFRLDSEKQKIYDLIQKTHLHASPDGPWFFLIAQSQATQFRLIGITDTSMLRPQVFAMQSGEVPIGIIASEKQAIDALLTSLSEVDNRFWPRADHYWSCRGGSYTDGGAFSFTVTPHNGHYALACTNKFGKPFTAFLPHPPGKWGKSNVKSTFPEIPAPALFAWAKERLKDWDDTQGSEFLNALTASAVDVQTFDRAFFVLSALLDHIYPMNRLRRSFWQALVEQAISALIHEKEYGDRIILNGRNYPAEGENSLARAIVRKYQEGHKKFIVGNCLGHRFIGNGLGPESHGVEIDVFGSPGDYLGSGIDGAHIRVHGNVQDQVAQIMKDGKLVIYGGTGQTLLYGAKGGTTFVRGSTGGRAVINAVGKTKLIINGSSLDYCAESCMAGDPLFGGGFVIINRIYFDNDGRLADMHPPYPGGNLFSLASGGAIYIRDPDKEVKEDQLNGGIFTTVAQKDEDLLIPYLEENALFFDIPLSRLLTKNDHILPFANVYRKIIPAPTHLLDPEAAWVSKPKRRF